MLFGIFWNACMVCVFLLLPIFPFPLSFINRQDELEALRAEVQQYSTTVDTIVRNQTNAANRTKQYEADVSTSQLLNAS